VRLELELNGRAIGLDADAAEPLLDVLRRAGLTSVRAGCGAGVCGACTVLLDDRPVSACLLAAAQADGRAVTTAEGVPPEDPVALAFERERAFECGWCAPGMVLTAKHLLEETPDPGDEQIAAALAGNLCRCGCYPRIRAAVTRAAAT
jgi:aerobic-type carbon monoxide dehydrogenase small subunit (CoxS/CutS family)